MRTISVKEAAGDLADTIARVRGDRQPLGIGGNGVAEVVLMPAVELDRLQKSAVGSSSRNFFERVGRMAGFGYWEWDEIADCCADCTEELARIFGVTVNEYRNIMNSTRAWLDRIHAEDRGRVEKTVLESRSLNCGYDVEYRLLRPDDSVLNVRAVAEPILDDDGRMIWSTGILQDLTEQRRMERELHHSRGLLEERVRERTADLRNSN
ncbi:MAG: PAS domain-containing protein, partial [Alphaproteobacteria bacterium]|nr:PAS domain-containing protein [Alphaproteobacteria bacterium]